MQGHTAPASSRPMKFRTEYKPTPSSLRLDPRRKVTLLGSCFAVNIGRRMQNALWDVCVNPLGALYNPISLGHTVMLALMPSDQRRNLLSQALVERDGIWLSWYFDSSVYGRSRQDYIDKASAALDILAVALAESQALVVTLGTAWVYRLRSDFKGIVSNCHKFPADRFDRILLTVDDICRWSDFFDEAVSSRLQHLHFIETVSPVRHLSDGFHENAISKATLLLTTQRVVDNSTPMHYFPVYEIVNDDLRDYRFYASDLTHPSEDAVDYIWDIFCQTYLDENGRRRVAEGEKLNARLHHRPLIPGAPSEAAFKAETDRLLQAFRKG